MDDGLARERRCPKCGHGQGQSEICNRCGLIFNKYYEIRERKIVIAQGLNKDGQPARQTRKSFGSIGWGSVMGWVVSIGIVGIALASSNLVNKNKPDLEIMDEIKQKVKAVQYENARELVRKYYDSDDQRAGYWFQFISEKEDLNAYLRNGREYFKKGVMLSRRGDMAGAADKFEKALRNFKESSDERSIVMASLNLAICYRILRKNQESLTHFENALNISKKYGYERYEAKALQGIGFIYNTLGLYEMARSRLKEALAMHEDIEDKKGEALDWLIMGVIEVNRHGDEAETYFRRALAMSKEVGDRMIQAKARRLLNKWLSRVNDNTPLTNSPPALKTL